MGLALRLNLFRDVDPTDVYGAFAEFYARRGASLTGPVERLGRYDLFERRGHWCALWWDSGWEWSRRREAQLFVSERLKTVGLLLFVYDGEYWGYELFRDGKVLDHFVQYPPGDGTQNWFPGDDCAGNAATFASCIDDVRVEDLAPYLVQRPARGMDTERWRALNVPPRSGDRFRRFDECAAIDFLTTIGASAELRGGHVAMHATVWRSFSVVFAP